MDLQKKIAENLLAKGAVKISLDPPFTLSSGIKAPIYSDNRLMIAFPQERKLVVEAFKDLIKEKGLKPDVIGGTATAAIPWAAFVAYDLDLPMIYIRPQKKAHGRGKQIEGALEPGQKVLIVEDLISTGGSSIMSAEAVREEGQCEVTDVFAIVTNQFPKAAASFAEADLQVSTLTDFSTLIALAVGRGDISQDQAEMVMDFRNDPQAWGEKHGV